jgi:Cysteine-rich secretory protein family
MAGWMAEITQYNPSAPVASHFTQVVWKGTSQIGCAKAVCGGIFPGFGDANFFVCEYLDAGNVIGQFA